MDATTNRRASCVCGALVATCASDPIRVSMCHCHACQQRTGSAFGLQARFRRDDVRIEGAVARFTRVADSGNDVTFHFCPACGTTLYWYPGGAASEFIAIAVGAFADGAFPPPTFSVYEERAHSWAVPTGADVEHMD